jgi:hypothetical protein
VCLQSLGSSSSNCNASANSSDDTGVKDVGDGLESEPLLPDDPSRKFGSIRLENKLKIK